MKYFLLPLIMFAMIISQSYESGDIILIGGGNIPKEISEFKGSYLVISTDVEYAKSVWDKILKVKKFIKPEELTYNDLEGLTGLVICGGDQWHYLNRLNGAIVDYAYHRGMDIIGTSAGAMILGEYYFSAECGGITSEEAACGIGLCLGRGFVHFSLLKGCLVDSHYGNRNRQGRLQIFIDKCGAEFGIGIDEETALQICSNGERKKLGIGSIEILSRKNRDIFP